MNYDLEDCIKDSFDNTMKDYLESTAREQETFEFNKMYFEFRNTLTSEEQHKFDALFNAILESDTALAHEAYYRGVVLGIAKNKQILSDIGLE